MTFAASGLDLLKATVGGGRQIFVYASADAHGTVEGTDYFAGMGGTARTSKGMKVGDIVFVIDTNLAACTVHFVTAVDSDGNATINAATLS